PQYEFLLAHAAEHEAPEQGWGNFGVERQGDLETAVEQWLVPVGYRTEPGDRIHLVGRWVIDCGHEDWHAELHPIEAFVSTHARVRSAASGGFEGLASVVVTGDWPGGRLALDLWPPARPAAAARRGTGSTRAGRGPAAFPRAICAPDRPATARRLRDRAPRTTSASRVAADAGRRSAADATPPRAASGTRTRASARCPDCLR